MIAHPLIDLHRLGQSPWLDQIRRALLASGALARLIDEDGVRGLTSNPTIFEKAIAGSRDYDEALRTLARQGRTAAEIYEALVIEDLQRSADLFRPLYDATDGQDGYVSLEVSPALADDTSGTVRSATALFAALNRPNVMIKIPATAAGLPAIEEAIAAGINVNVTLIFGRDVYGQVVDAYLRGLERRLREGQALRLASVASFFVSRVDTAVDGELDRLIARAANDTERIRLRSLQGKTAIANAKLAYQDFKGVFSGERFAALRAHGARPQRPLWASTGTKNPQYSDVLYVDSLIGPDTVTTLPPDTLHAFRDHGVARATLEDGLQEARTHLQALESVGIHLDAVTSRLREAGVASFAESFSRLMRVIEARRDGVTRCLIERLTTGLGAYTQAVDDTMGRFERATLVSRLWSKDPTVWTDDPAHGAIISNALGWLTVAEKMEGRVAELNAFAEGVRDDGFEHAVVLGMGGSSLCSEVLRETFGPGPGGLALHVLDSTVPAAVRVLEGDLNLERTLFIVASKSGTTTEPRMFHRYFYDRVRAIRGGAAGSSFVAITDPGTPLVADAERDGFRRIFLNPADIGGRYSALSHFGLVPAALLGIDLSELLDRALHAVHACSDVVPVSDNPGARLGAVLGTLAARGRDKLTLVIPPPLEALSLWIEQLIAESTGKQGTGLVPVGGEPLGPTEVYGTDRVFIRIDMAAGATAPAHDAALDRLAAAGHPVLRYTLHDTLDLGEAFFLWEFAVAVAGSVLGIDAFDQPNVQESKDNTRRLLAEYTTRGAFPSQHGVRELRVSREQSEAADGARATPADWGAFRALLDEVRPGDYVAVMAYIAPTPEHDEALTRLQRELRDRLHVPVTTAYGPRFLHSTGQLHKGGPHTGVFIQITADDEEDLEIPGERFTFGVLKQAQALGDLESLVAHRRRAIRVHLGRHTTGGLEQMVDAVTAPAS